MQSIDALAEGRDHPRGLVAKHRRQLALHVPIDHIGGANAAGEHIADDLARTRSRLVDVLDPDVVKRD
jgi:hypothetical protein